MIKKFIILNIIFGIALFIWLIYLYAQIRFEVDSVVNYKPNLTTQFVDKNNNLIANVFKGQHRFYVKYDDIPPKIVESLIAIEDTQFFEHNGINIDAILRAIIKDIKHMKLVEGASTITQQLVRTLALSRDKKIIRKIKEILLSLRVESLLTKEEILERYLNEVYFGHGYYGIKTASIGYFNKQLHELNIKEIAILVGLPQAPSFYDPTRNLKLSLARANQVVRRLKTLGWINKTQFNEAIDFQPTIINQTLTQNKAPYVIDHAIKQLEGKVKNLKSSGYTIKLTIDLQAQEIAKNALQFGYDRIKKRDSYIDTNKSTTKTLNGAIISIENSTGKILTMVGGIDYKKSSFNRVTQARRQAGSSIKPFIYQSALNLGYSPLSDLVDISRTYEYEDKTVKDKNNNVKKWKPSNYESNYRGIVSLRYALVHSRNLATINLVQEMGIDILYKNLLYYGFKDIPYDMSITLGSFGISPLDLSHIYTILSNQGIRIQPYLIQSIKKDINNIVEFKENKTYIQEKSQAFLSTSILKDVVQNGTGRRARVKNLELVGKTGTTNNYKDAWFCGYSPTIQTIVWFGNDDNSAMKRSETGGGAAAPVFKYFYENYLKIHPEIQRKFTLPNGVNTRYINGKNEYFTDISPIPKSQNNQLDKIYFNQVEF
jgi:penicillin-binding protein 1A